MHGAGSQQRIMAWPLSLKSLNSVQLTICITKWSLTSWAVQNWQDWIWISFAIGLPTNIVQWLMYQYRGEKIIHNPWLTVWNFCFIKRKLSTIYCLWRFYLTICLNKANQLFIIERKLLAFWLMWPFPDLLSKLCVCVCVLNRGIPVMYPLRTGESALFAGWPENRGTDCGQFLNLSSSRCSNYKWVYTCTLYCFVSIKYYTHDTVRCVGNN